jgi:protein-S-isoprenylcysteine O-methyltransferase Ste14
MPHPALILFLIAYCVLHSLLASLPAKAGARRLFGDAADRWYRLAYNIIAIVTLLPLLPLLALLPDQVLYVVPAPWRWLMFGGQALAVLGMFEAVRQTGTAHFLGLRQLHKAESSEGGLVESGLYAYVRHPIYTAGLLFIWLSPAMSANLLTVYIFWSFYMVLGTFHEEQRLMREFGATYESYRQRVPRLIPRLPTRWKKIPEREQ